MKKFYTTLALAAAVAFGAYAEAPAQKALQLSEPVAAASMKATDGVSTSMGFQKVGGQKVVPASRDELLGMYFGQCQGFLQSWNGVQDASITLYAGEGPNDVVMTITAYNTFENIKGTVDMTAKTISFPKQNLEFSDRYNEWMYLCYEETNTKAQSVITDKPCVFSFAEDGVLKMTSNLVKAEDGENYWSGMLAVRISLGYFTCAGNFEVPRFAIDDFDLEGWTKVGTAKYQDAGWIMSGIFGYATAESLPFQDVEYYTKTIVSDIDEEEHSLIALYQPYAWYNNFLQTDAGLTPDDPDYAGLCNKSTTTGAIVIDITWPQAVLVYQGYYCGAEIGEEADGDYYWPYNQEYVEFALNGFDGDDIAGGLDEVSTYDEGAGVIEITNCYFGVNNAPTASYRWVDANRDPIPTKVLVQLDAQGSALNTVITDNNAPVEYYNLQGQRVADDAKGLVIRKQGNNVAKIVR